MATSSEGKGIKEEEVCGEEGQYSVGWKFCPTDVELIIAFLLRKNLNLPLPSRLIKDVDFYSSYPWDLHRQFRMKSVTECYFFTRTMDVSRSNRKLPDGFWELTRIGLVDITSDREVIGVRRTLVFHKRSLSKSVETDWMVHEYKFKLDLNFNPAMLPTMLPSKKLVKCHGWLLCKLFNKTSSDSDEREKAASLLQRDLYMEWLRRSEHSKIIV